MWQFSDQVFSVFADVCPVWSAAAGFLGLVQSGFLCSLVQPLYSPLVTTGWMCLLDSRGIARVGPSDDESGYDPDCVKDLFSVTPEPILTTLSISHWMFDIWGHCCLLCIMVLEAQWGDFHVSPTQTTPLVCSLLCVCLWRCELSASCSCHHACPWRSLLLQNHWGGFLLEAWLNHHPQKPKVFTKNSDKEEE